MLKPNFSEGFVVLVDEGTLARRIKLHIKTVASYFDRLYGFRSLSYDQIFSTPGTVVYQFKKHFLLTPYMTNHTFDGEWLKEAFCFVKLGEALPDNSLLEQLLRGSETDFKKAAQLHLKRGLWLLLILLYGDGSVLLPASLKAMQFKKKKEDKVQEFGFEFYPELMRFTISARDKFKLLPFWQKVDKKVRERVAQYGSRLFWILGARRPEEINLESLVEAHRVYYHMDERLAGELPVHTIMPLVCSYFDGRVSFGMGELLSRLNALREEKYRSVTLVGANASSLSELYSRARSEDNLLDYCRLVTRVNYAASRIDRVHLSELVLGFEGETFDSWVKVQRSYLRMKNYEKEESSSIGLAYLNIYLFLYLPKWFELELGASEDYSYPKHISDFGHIFQAPLEREDHAPMSLSHFVAELTAHSEASYYQAFQQIFAMFNWIVAKGDPSTGGFKNHITKLDLPSSPVRPISNKRPFTTTQYGLGVNYLFNIFTAMRLINDDLIGDNVGFSGRGLKEYALSLGWSPVFYYGGREYEVNSLPVYFFRKWHVLAKDGRFLTLYAPHLLVHTLTALESGLRHQTVQWLACDFDKYIIGSLEMNKAVWLNSVIDKVSKDPIKTIVSSQVMIALRYQKKIRDLVSAVGFDEEIVYENRTSGAMTRLLPLFSYCFETGAPHSDSMYYSAYCKFIVDFQLFMNKYGFGVKFFELKPKYHRYGDSIKPSLVSVELVEFPYCSIRVVTDMTPHHTRNSTVKVWRRLLQDTEVGKYKTGQKENTVRYYDPLLAEDYDDVIGKVSPGLDKIWNGQRLDPSLPQSDFRIALAANPVKAINDFSCISMSHVSLAGDDSGLLEVIYKHSAKLAHHSTHVCTRNDQCPSHMVESGQERRCGPCIYSVKGVDNVPAIDVKIFNLACEVDDLHAYADSLDERNQFELAKVDSRLDQVVNDLLGWTWSRDYLLECLRNGGKDKFVTVRPDLLKKNFREIDVSGGELEYLFANLYQCSLFPELQTDVVRARFNMMRAQLMGGAGLTSLFKVQGGDASKEIVSRLKSLVAISGETISSLIGKIEGDTIDLGRYEQILLCAEG